MEEFGEDKAGTISVLLYFEICLLFMSSGLIPKPSTVALLKGYERTWTIVMPRTMTTQRAKTKLLVFSSSGTDPITCSLVSYFASHFIIKNHCHHFTTGIY